MAIYKRQAKAGVRYFVRVKDSHGRWFPGKTFTTQAMAKKYERHLMQMRDEGTFAPSSQMKAITLNQYFEVWFSECRTNISEGWKQSQNQMFRDHISPFIGGSKVVSITQRDIGSLMKRLSDKGLKEQTRSHVYNLLRKMFVDAIEYYELIRQNPVFKKFKPAIPKKERSFLTTDQSWMLMETCRDEWYGPAIWIGLLSALRPCEIQALRWDQVDFDNQQILIKRAYSRKEKVIKDFPKQKDWGKAPMPTVLVEYLRELRKQSMDSIFVAQDNWGRMLGYDHFYRALKSACQVSGLPKITPHELRHSATELYYTAGAGTEDLKRLLNHSSASTTQRYIHRTDDRLRNITAAILPKSPQLHNCYTKEGN